MSEIQPSRFDPIEPFQRADNETTDEYEAFKEYCFIPPSSRTQINLSRRTGLTGNWISRIAKKNMWDERATAFDNAAQRLRPDPSSMDEEASKAAQLAAAAMLSDLGSLALSMKNPAQIKVADAKWMVEKGIELQRKALGEADLTIKIDKGNMERVDDLIGEVLSLEADDVEEIEDDSDEEQGS